jgi:hypothetical protein
VRTPRNDASWAADPQTGRSLEEEMAIQIERGHADGAGFLDGLSDEDLAEFALALEVQAELEAQDAAAGVPGTQAAAAAEPTLQDAPASEPGVIPLRRPERKPRRLGPQWVALAAVLAGVMLLPFAWRTMQGGAVRYPSQAVAMLENPAAGLPDDWELPSPRNQTRSDGDLFTENQRSARLGAYMVQLELAVRARDAERTSLLADRAAFLVQNVTAGGLLTSAFGQLKEQAGGDPSTLLPQVEEVNETAASLLNADYFALGAWAGAARLAVTRQDAEFFRSARTRRTLDRAAELVVDEQGAGDAVRTLSAAAESDPPDWSALRTASDNLFSAVAG